MPDHLTSEEQMVAWMLKEMPKAVENAAARSPIQLWLWLKWLLRTTATL
jgi:hypothetical protein